MSEWMTLDEDFASDPFSDVEDLLRLATEDLPVVRSGLKAEIVTHAHKAQRELRAQHVLWGAVTMLLFVVGALIWGPVQSGSALASRSNHAPKPINASLLPATDAVDWDLVESETRDRERNLEILQNAF